MGEDRDCWWGNLREIDHVEDLDLDGKVRLKWILKKFLECCGLH
jgi:hypothetical protein